MTVFMLVPPNSGRSSVALSAPLEEPSTASKAVVSYEIARPHEYAGFLSARTCACYPAGRAIPNWSRTHARSHSSSHHSWKLPLWQHPLYVGMAGSRTHHPIPRLQLQLLQETRCRLDLESKRAIQRSDRR